MVSERKKQMLKKVNEELKQNPVVCILNMHKLPGRQLHDIRNKLRGEAKIFMTKKRVITKAIHESKHEGLNGLEEHVKGSPALLLSSTNPFKLARKLEKSKSRAGAKAGDIAPEDIVIKAGPTPLPPGPAIGDLQKIKLPAGVQGDKIHVMKDTVVAKEGEEISADVANVLSKLGIEPMEIGLDLVAAWEDGTVYPSDILFVPLSEYKSQVKDAVSAGFNLSININLFTPDTVPVLVAKAGSEAMSLALNAGIITPETLGPILSKATAQAGVLSGMIKEPAAEPAKEEANEEPATDNGADQEDGKEKEDTGAEENTEEKAEEAK